MESDYRIDFVVEDSCLTKEWIRKKRELLALQHIYEMLGMDLMTRPLIERHTQLYKDLRDLGIRWKRR